MAGDPLSKTPKLWRSWRTDTLVVDKTEHRSTVAIRLITVAPWMAGIVWIGPLRWAASLSKTSEHLVGRHAVVGGCTGKKYPS